MELLLPMSSAANREQQIEFFATDGLENPSLSLGPSLASSEAPHCQSQVVIRQGDQ